MFIEATNFYVTLSKTHEVVSSRALVNEPANEQRFLELVLANRFFIKVGEEENTPEKRGEKHTFLPFVIVYCSTSKNQKSITTRRKQMKTNIV